MPAFAENPKAPGPRTVAAPVIVPTPESLVVDPQQRTAALDKRSRILVRGGRHELERHGKVLAGEIEILTGLRIAVVAGDAPAERTDVVLANTGSDSEDESYKLSVSERGIAITANSFVGITHGTATLLQLVDGANGAVPMATIGDRPRSPYRALMLDVARSPHSIGVLKDAVRLCRLYKIRYLHLHLTDDQHFTFPFPPVTDKLQDHFHYPLEALKELVAYADARGVTIIPELEVPGHSGRLRQSGYLSPSKTDADVASPKNYEKIGKIVDAMIDVFSSSPYFHIGGDESGAGDELVPFLAEMNKRVRKRGKRMLVWEGFHGAPTESLPATGDDRIVVIAWESLYNPPWNLLEHGYQIINASFKPNYLVGGYGGLIHPGSSGSNWFPLKAMYRWDKNTFMHWEPGRPVFEDRGPNDPNRSDGEWNAGWIGKSDQILGGQLVYWEQHECSVMHFIPTRLPIVAERLWNPKSGHSFDAFQKRLARVHRRILPILQPIEISPIADDPSHPLMNMYTPYSGDRIHVTLRNRTRIDGRVRYSTGGWSGSLGGGPNFPPVPVPDNDYQEPLTAQGPLSLRAELVRPDGTPVDGHSWQFYNNWPDRVVVTDYDIGRRTPRKVPDLAALPEDQIVRRYRMPILRGPLQNVMARGQMSETQVIAPADGKHTLELRTQSGHATLFFDRNQSGRFEKGEVLVRDSPNDELGQKVEVLLKKGERYRIRIDHATGVPRPVLLLFITGPDGQQTEISKHLQLPENRPVKEETERNTPAK